MKVLYKRRWTAVAIFLLIVGSVTVYTFTATPIFEARTRLLIEAENQNVVSFKAVLDGDQTRADYYQTQYNILQSRALARRTLDELKLWDTPPFGGKADERFSLKRTILGAPAALASSVGRPLRVRRHVADIGPRRSRRGRNGGAVARHRRVCVEPDRRADPQQPAGRSASISCPMPAWRRAS